MKVYEYIDLIDKQLKEQEAVYHNAAVKFGLSDSAMWILYMITGQRADVTQQVLCRQSSFAKQTINTAISNLVKNGYVSLEPISGAKNQKRIILTEKGRELTKSTTDILRGAEERAYSCLSEDELDVYLKMTEKITSSLRREIQTIETDDN